jgi:hypothetical protein
VTPWHDPSGFLSPPMPELLGFLEFEPLVATASRAGLMMAHRMDNRSTAKLPIGLIRARAGYLGGFLRTGTLIRMHLQAEPPGRGSDRRSPVAQ